MRWPIHGTGFNTRQYNSLQVILSDIETILRYTLTESVGVDAHDYKAHQFHLPNVLDFLY